jgi:hypothetical protein
VTIFFTGTKLLVLDVLSWEEKFNQDHCLAAIAPELSKENSNSKRRVDKNGLIVHMGNSVYYHRRKIQAYCARKGWRESPIQFIPRSVTVWLLLPLSWRNFFTNSRPTPRKLAIPVHSDRA